MDDTSLLTALLSLHRSILAPLAGAASLYRVGIGGLLSDDWRRAQLAALLAETVAVGRARGIALAPDQEAKTLAVYGRMPAEMKPSMLHDLEAGRRLEVDWLNGEVVRLGRELGIETPANAAVIEALEAVKLGREA